MQVSKLEFVVGFGVPIREIDYIIWQNDYNDGIFKIWSHILGLFTKWCYYDL